jgi:hypothetical protein
VNNEHSFKTVLPSVSETPGRKRCGEGWDQENITACLLTAFSEKNTLHLTQIFVLLDMEKVKKTES